MDEEPRERGGGRRRHRRAVGPPGAAPPGGEPRLELDRPDPLAGDDEDRLRSDRPPHHDQGV